MTAKIATLVITDTHKQYLAAKDPVLHRLIAQIPLSELVLRTEYFPALARAVVGQQVSIHAARAIFNRLERACDQDLTPQAVLRLPAATLVSVGLSQRKIAYIRELAERVESHSLDLPGLAEQSDDAVIAALTSVKGIGEWTAQMFLIFALGRPNVLATRDVGLRRSLVRLYRMDPEALTERMAEFRQLWSPYCTIASLYLWGCVK